MNADVKQKFEEVDKSIFNINDEIRLLKGEIAESDEIFVKKEEIDEIVDKKEQALEGMIEGNHADIMSLIEQQFEVKGKGISGTFSFDEGMTIDIDPKALMGQYAAEEKQKLADLYKDVSDIIRDTKVNLDAKMTEFKHKLDNIQNKSWSFF